MRPGRAAFLLATAALLVAAPAPAPAAAAGAETCVQDTGCTPPQCYYDDIYARPGLERAHRLTCYWADSVEVLEGPAHGTVSDVDFYGLDLTFRHRPDDDAPRDDRIVFRVKGPMGTTDHTVHVHVTPRDENTPPRCDPVEIAKRTTGLTREWLSFYVWCRDEEHDAFMIEGGGPGEHSNPQYVESEPGSSNTGWGYRPVVTSGNESTTYWATDDLGARSEDAPISVRVGLVVDRLPTCGPNPYLWAPGGRMPVYMRAGATRRFGVICEDPDGDPIVPVLTDLPERGAMTIVPGPPQVQYDGSQQTWLDSTYVPKPGVDPGPDDFAIKPVSPLGAGPDALMQMTPTTDEHGGGCGWVNGANTTTAVPVPLPIWCADDEGDEWHAEVVGPPEHGTTTSPVVTPGLYGWDDVDVAYVPNPGFTGWDCVVIRVYDGENEGHTITYNIHVTAPELPVDPPEVELPPVDPPEVELPPVDPPEVELPPVDPPQQQAPPEEPQQQEGPGADAETPPVSIVPPPRRPGQRAEGTPLLATTTGSAMTPFVAPVTRPLLAAQFGATREPTAGQAPPLTPAQQARRALRTRHVRLVRRIRDARVYAKRGRRRSVVAISCPIACTVKAGDRTVRVTPGTARVVRVPSKGLRLSLRDVRGPAGRATIRARSG